MKPIGIISALIVEIIELQNIIQPPVIIRDIGPRRVVEGYLSGKKLLRHYQVSE